MSDEQKDNVSLPAEKEVKKKSKAAKKEDNVENMDMPSVNENVQPEVTPVESNPVQPNETVNNMSNGMQMNGMNNQPMNNQPMNNQPMMDDNALAMNNNPFNSNGNMSPKPKINFKKLLVPILAGVAVLVLVVGMLVVSIVSSSPKSIFKNSVNSIYKELSNGLHEFDDFKKKFDFTDKALVFEGDVSIKTNVDKINDELGDISKLKFGVKAGFDLKNEQILVGGNVKGKSEALTADFFVKDGKEYLSTNLYDKTIKVSDEEKIDFKEVQEVLDKINEDLDWDVKDYDFVLKKFKNAFIKALDNKAMKKSSSKFEVDGKTVKATKVSYILDDNAMKDIVKKLCEELLEDDEFIAKVAKISTLEKADIKEAIKTVKNEASDIDYKGEVLINVYIKGLLNKPVGFSIEYEDSDYYSVYTDGKTTEITYDNHVKSEYGREKYVITAKEDKKKTDVEVVYNKKKVMTAEIREMSDKLVDFDAVIYDDGKKVYDASVYLSKKEDKKSLSGDYKVKVGFEKEYVEVQGTYKLEAKDELDLADTGNTEDYDDVDTKKISDETVSIIEKDEVFSSVFGDYIDEIKKSGLDLNENEMIALKSEKKAIELFNNKEATVLYVGTYGYGNDYYLWNYLAKALKSTKSYAYYLNTDYVGSDFTSAAVKYVCPNNKDTGSAVSSACATFPAIYFIKDGEVKKVVKGSNIVYSEITDALNAIGISQTNL